MVNKGNNLISHIKRTAMRARVTGMSTSLLAMVLAITPSAKGQTFDVLWSFGFESDGRNPNAGVIADSAGDFYGTTYDGGAYGYGAVYELLAAGGETVLYSFTGGKDGANPVGGLVRDAAGNLYGTTEFGGRFGVCPFTRGCGVVFGLSPQGKEKVLYAFSGGSDGAAPLAGLVRDATGNFYGTASAGGAFGGLCGEPFGCGVVFKVARNGTETTLHIFEESSSTDGADPAAGLVIDGAGNLYGTTAAGGTVDGAIFGIDPSGNESVLYNFQGSPTDGNGPFASLFRDDGGNLYGTTFFGGSNGAGTVFKLDSTGLESVLYSFAGTADGGYPLAGVVVDPKGNLYGTSSAGGNLTLCDGAGCGVVFKLSPAGREVVLHTLDSLDGAGPVGNLLPYKGYLYGTTTEGGGFGDGEVFRVQP